MSRRVLLTGHGADADAVAAARRTVPYERLVLLSAAPDDPALARLEDNEALAGVDVEVRPVDARDLLACLAEARAALDAHARDVVRVHVAGGPNLLTNALLLAAFQKGVEAFFCHPRGTSRLPVAVTVDLAERFGERERAVLRALPPQGTASLDALDVPGLAAASVKGALLRLRKDGLVRADHRGAELTPTGAYYRAHLS